MKNSPLNKNYLFFLLFLLFIVFVYFYNISKWEKRYNIAIGENKNLKQDIFNCNDKFKSLSTFKNFYSNELGECELEIKVLKNREKALKVEAEKNTSYKLMLELLAQQNLEYSNYKIFEEIKSPNLKNIAVLYGLNTKECCGEPTAIFINKNGTLYQENFALVGALQHLFLNNVRWENNSSVLFDDNITHEPGTYTISTKNIVIK